MAERLTRNNKVNFYFHDEASNIVYYKLQKLEDIMEKYGIDSLEELIRHLSYTVEYDVIAKLEYEKDTWKRACELASETLKQVMGKPLWIGGNIPTPEVKDSDYFFQQAKKEGEQK